MNKELHYSVSPTTRMAALAVVVLMSSALIYFFPLSLGTLACAATPAATTPKQKATTQPATQPETEKAGGIPLYYVNQAEGDPEWSLPAELKSEDLQRLAHQVQKLENDLPATAVMEERYIELVGRLYSEQLIDLFWSGVLGKGFRDKKLPLDWYDIVKDKDGMDAIAQNADLLANAMVMTVIQIRMNSVRVRIIGGRVLIGDILFVKAAQAYVDNRRPFFEKQIPFAKNVFDRAVKEFPGGGTPSQE